MKGLKLAPLLAIWLVLPAGANDHKEPPVQPATSFAAVEVHDKEKVAVAAEPYDTKEKEAIFRVDYLSHGVMPVRLIVTNNGDRPSPCATRAFSFKPEPATGSRPRSPKMWNG